MRLCGVQCVRAASKIVENTRRYRDYDQLFVANLHWITGKKQLEEHFAKFGRVVKVKMPLNVDDGVSKGYAFIKFASNDSLNRAISAGHEQEIDNKLVYVSQSK